VTQTKSARAFLCCCFN